ncbi:MAG TPA: AlkA N-terminal domain-containing protein [Gemmatimonadales bacterium]|nr:AlkA N-terminal domain-containing protein [Gemmatimonadales bacterium]
MALPLTADVCERALNARDARFDGIFFVGITTTGIYCRPICPARVSYHDRRRFFDSAAAAERAGFRPCLRCRPELAPGRALCDAVPRLARVAAQRIAAGALNGREVRELGRELGVSDRHLRRVLERELGVSPVELAQTHRLLLAKRLLADTSLPVTRIAYASGFQSLRRFNSVFRERYRLSPTALRRGPRAPGSPAASAGDLVRLTLAYRAPFAWPTLLALLGCEMLPGVELVDGARYGRTVRLEGKSGVVFATDSAAAKTHLDIDVSPTLLPALLPLLARLRRLFDLDAEPTVVDAHLAREGLGVYVARRPGLRIPGAFDGFEAAFGALLGGRAGLAASDTARRVVEALAEPVDTGIPALRRIAPDAPRVAEAGTARLAALGVPSRAAETLVSLARALAGGMLWLEPGSDIGAAHRALLAIDGVGERLANRIVMHALHWPDAFDPSDRAIQTALDADSPAELQARAERWRPWRAYAALHLRLGSVASARVTDSP